MKGVNFRLFVSRTAVWGHWKWKQQTHQGSPRLSVYRLPTTESCRLCATGASSTTNTSRPVFTCNDIVAPATELWTTKRDGTVRLRMTESGPGSAKPKTIHTLLQNTVDRIPDNTALAVKRNGSWQKWTYSQYYQDVIKVAKSFIKLGLQSSHGVGIIGFNSPEWFLSNLGAIVAGGLGTGIYTTNTAEACEYVLANSAANIAVVENDEQLQKILQVWDNLPELKAVIQYTGDVSTTRKGVYSWKEFMEISENVPDSVLQDRLSQQSPNKACVLLHTSGTTGNPKGVLQSHDNAVWLSQRLLEYNTDIKYGKESIVSYLPLSHTFAQTVDMFFMLTIGGEVTFADPDALKGTLVNTLQEVRPTLFIAVPRVVEKFEERMKDKSLQVTGLKKKLGAWARRKGLEGVNAKISGGSPSFAFNLANKLVFDKVKAQLGLDRVWLAVVGAAPLKRETLDYFFSFNVIFSCGFGMTENAGPACSEKHDNIRISSCGKTFGGCSIKVSNPDEKGIGEILINGRHVFMGYVDMEQQTKESLNEEGWLKSGDLGYIDSDDYVYITGKIKELVITAGGENVAPVPIEDNVKEELPIVANCMLIGDSRKFLSLLITLKTEINAATGAPRNELTPEAIHWCKSVGSNATTVDQILTSEDKLIQKAIQSGIDRVNTKAVSHAAHIQKWTILPRDFSIFGGELGPTTKVRRPIVMEMYEDLIESLYRTT